MMISDPTYAALSAPQRAVLALQAAWAGKRPEPSLLAMPPEQRPEFDRLYRDAEIANIELARLIRAWHAQAEQERLTFLAWEMEALHAGMLDELRWSLEPVGDPKLASLLEGGCALQCPLRLDDPDETPARWQLLKGSRDRLVGIANRAYATADILEVIQGELGADPLHADLRLLLEETEELVEETLWRMITWIGQPGISHDADAYGEVHRIVAEARRR